MQILNFVIGMMLKNKVYTYSDSSNVWLDESEHYTQCHLQLVLKDRPTYGWTNQSIILNAICN